MTDARATTWHYGAVARWWAEFNVDGGPELDFYRPYVEAGAPTLDVACGTGRLLIPYLHAGLDVDGADISPDMLALCRERALHEGLPAPNLYVQAAHELELPRRYSTILMCGGFGLGGSRAHDAEALCRMYRHLVPGGTLLLDNEVPYAQSWWRSWRKDERVELPRPWRELGDRRTAADGTELELSSRLVDLDPLAQRVTLEMRASADGQTEVHTLKMTEYFTQELVLLLERAGFVDVQLRAGYAQREPTRDDDVVVFIAHKPA